MEIALNSKPDVKLSDLILSFKIQNVEKLIEKMFQDASKSTSIYYIGEYNKTDIML